MRLTAEDLIAYCEDPKYEARDWPDGYWPESPEPPSSEAWLASSRRLLEATEKMARIVEDPDLESLCEGPRRREGTPSHFTGSTHLARPQRLSRRTAHHSASGPERLAYELNATWRFSVVSVA